LNSADILRKKALGIEYDPRQEIVWVNNDQASLNSQADTIAKFTAAGIPIDWSAPLVLRSSSPKEINDLLAKIDAKRERNGLGTEISFTDLTED